MKEKDLSAAEKHEIVECLGQGIKKNEEKKKLKHDHRTVKRFVAGSQQRRVPVNKGTMRTLSDR